MPGVHALSFLGSSGTVRLQHALADQGSDPWVTPEILWEAEGHAVAFSGHPAYPRRTSFAGGSRTLLEGAVYNRSRAEVDRSLLEIAEAIGAGREITDLVEAFMMSSEGDFIVVIYNEPMRAMVVFNDRWGRLPAYYYQSTGCVVLSRSAGFLLPWIPEISFDKMSLAEFLMMGYVLGDKALIKGVRKLAPGALVQVSALRGELTCAVSRILKPFFGHRSTTTEVVALDRCNEMFLRALADRVRFCKEAGLRPTVDVTAGRDSRANYVGLSRLQAEADYFSDDLDTHNECEYLPPLEAIYGADIRRVPLKTPAPDFVAMRQLTYWTDCTVNCWTAFLAEHKTLERRKLIANPAARFMGFGGEFIRTVFHVPYLYSSITELLKDSVYSSIFDINQVARLMGTERGQIVDHLDQYFSGYDELELQDRLKHLYFEYYNVLVNAGENRHRRHFWTVAPLWSLDLLSYVMAELPTFMLDHSFFDRFLERIDRRATAAPFYRRGADAGTRASVLTYHTLGRLRKLTYGWPLLPLRRRAKRIIGGEQAAIAQPTPVDAEILSTLQTTPSAANYFSSREVHWITSHRVSQDRKYQLLTVLHYLSEIGRRHGNASSCSV